MKHDDKVWKKWREIVGKNKYVLLVAAAGVLIMMLPTSFGKADKDAAQALTEPDAAVFSVQQEEERLTHLLQQIEGAGKVTVMLALHNDGRQILAENSTWAEDGQSTEETTQPVIVSNGDGAERPVVLQSIAPQYAGAVVVAEGAGVAEVRLKITNAVCAVTGLGSDRVAVIH